MFCERKAAVCQNPCKALNWAPLWERVVSMNAASQVSIQCQNNSTIRAAWRALQSAPLWMESSLLLYSPLHNLPTLTLQPIQLWLEKPLGFQSLQSFDHNEFQSLPPPALCSLSNWRSYKRKTAERGDKERRACRRWNMQPPRLLKGHKEQASRKICCCYSSHENALQSETSMIHKNVLIRGVVLHIFVSWFLYVFVQYNLTWPAWQSRTLKISNSE